MDKVDTEFLETLIRIAYEWAEASKTHVDKMTVQELIAVLTKSKDEKGDD